MIGIGIGNSIASKQPGGEFSLDGLGLDLKIWYDFSTSTDSHGTDVGTFPNAGNTGSTHNLVQDAETTEPTVDTAGMKLKCLKFDNVNDGFALANEFDSANTNTIAAVIKSNTGAWNWDNIFSGTTAGVNRIYVESAYKLSLRYNANYPPDPFNSTIGIFLNNTDNGTINYPLPTTSVEVLILRKDGSNNLHIYNKNGDKIAYLAYSDSFLDMGVGIGYVGTREASNESFGGFIGELAVFDGHVDEATCQTIATGLRDKWSL